MEILYFGKRDSKTVLVQMVDEHDLLIIENEVEKIRELSHSNDFLLVAVKVDDWQKDLSPWSAPAVFGGYAFGDGAKSTLEFLKNEVIAPLSRQNAADGSKTKFYIGGYSLAGLFALWSAYETDAFEGVAAASPSVWFEGFSDFASSNDIKANSVYLSLGDKEEKTKNQTMSKVGGAIRTIYSRFNKKVRCRLEWNEGGHFKDADVRTAKAFAWLLDTN